MSRRTERKSRGLPYTPRRPLADRFWEKVRKVEGDGCWEWQGTRRRKGDPTAYGLITYNRRVWLAHRVAWMLTHDGVDPGELHICHHCDNPPCCRPDHLFSGTHADNMRDCRDKGRMGTWTKPERRARGERHWTSKLTGPHPAAKLSAADITMIEQADINVPGWAARLAEQFGVQTTTIWNHRRVGRLFGERVVTAKLNPIVVREIRQAAAGGLGCRKIAALFGISKTQATNIISHRQWRHVE